MSTIHLKEFDDELRSKFGKNLIGIDEAGRGAWAHCIVGASVCLRDDFFIEGITDSKKLSELKREEYYDEIIKNAQGYSIQLINATEIDSNGINWANIQVMERSANEVANMLDEVGCYIIDQSPCYGLNPHVMMSKADSTSLSVASASILAKTYRDRLMMQLHQEFPQYGFNQNKGYIDQKHVDAVLKNGIIKGIYRESYKVKGYNKPNQLKLT